MLESITTRDLEVSIPSSSGQQLDRLISLSPWRLTPAKSQSLLHQVNNSILDASYRNQFGTRVTCSLNPFFIRSTTRSRSVPEETLPLIPLPGVSIPSSSGQQLDPSPTGCGGRCTHHRLNPFFIRSTTRSSAKEKTWQQKQTQVSIPSSSGQQLDPAGERVFIASVL